MPIQGLSLVGLLPEPISAQYFLNACCLSETSPEGLSAKWNEARARVSERIVERPGEPEMRPLSSACASHIDELTRQPRFQQSFANQAISFQEVEIAPLLAAQVHMTDERTASTQDAARDGTASVEDLLALCLPIELAKAEPRWVQQGDENFGFAALYCEDLNFRIIQGGVAPPVEETAMQMAGINVGMGIGIVHVMRHKGRSFIANGFHRAVTLMLAGCTRIPCMVRDLPDSMADPSILIGQQLGQLLNQAEPPATCGDYRWAIQLPLRRMQRVIHMSWSQIVLPAE